MAHISINLLPIEYTQTTLKQAKFYKVQALGIVIILLMVFLSSLSVVLRVLQNQNIKGVTSEVSAQEQKITSLKDKQVSLLLLQNRLQVINQYLGISSKQVRLYQLLDKLLPQTVIINSVSVDKTGQIVISALMPDSLILDDTLNNLVDKQMSDNMISQVSIDNISRGKDGVYRVSLTIKPL